MKTEFPDSGPHRALPLRRVVRWVGGVLTLAIVLYSAGWYAHGRLLRAAVEEWIADRRGDGFAVETSAIEVAGFPTRLFLRLSDIRIETPASRGGWRWRTQRLNIEASPLSVTHFSLDFFTPLDIAGGWLPPDAPLRLSAQQARFAFTVAPRGRLSQAHLVAVGAAAYWPTPDRMLGQAALIDADVALFGDDGAAPLTTSRLALGFADLKLAVPEPFSNTIRKAALTVDVTGAVGAGPLPQVLEAWRSGGGTLEVKNFLLDWPPLSVTGGGTAALDEQLQPEGAFTAHIGGFDETIDLVVKQSALAQGEGALIKSVLGLLSRRTADGNRTVSVSVTVQNRKLTVGPVTVLELPAVTWPAVPVP